MVFLFVKLKWFFYNKMINYNILSTCGMPCVVIVSAYLLYKRYPDHFQHLHNELVELYKEKKKQYTLEFELIEAIVTEPFGNEAKVSLISPLYEFKVNDVNDNDKAQYQIYDSWAKNEGKKLQNLSDHEVIKDLLKIRLAQEDEDLAGFLSALNIGTISTIVSVAKEQLDDDPADQVMNAVAALKIDDDDDDSAEEIRLGLVNEAVTALAQLSIKNNDCVDTRCSFDSDLAVFNDNGDIIVQDLNLYAFFCKYMNEKQDLRHFLGDQDVSDE